MSKTLIQHWISSRTKPVPGATVASPPMVMPQAAQAVPAVQTLPVWPLPTDQELRVLFDREHEVCPFHGWVAQDSAIRQLTNIIATGLRDKHHRLPSSTALLHVGMRSSGKTQAAEVLFSDKALALPYMKVNAKEIRGIQTILQFLFNIAEQAGHPLVPMGEENGRTLYEMIPCGLIMDELHAMMVPIMDEMLNMLEADDHTLSTPDCMVNVRNVIWVGCTTEHGTLFDKHDAFESRFEKIEFVGYTRDEVAEILQRNFRDWTHRECELLAVYAGRIVREAKKMAAKVERELMSMKLHDPTTTRITAIREVGKQLGIDDNGMSKKQIKVLDALARRWPKGMTLGQLAQVIGDKEDKVKHLVLPALELDAADHPALVCRPSRTFITKAGMEELLRRGQIDQEQVDKFDT